MSYLWLLLLIPVLLVAEVLVRTVRFKPGPTPQIPEGEEIYYISNPALGLWALRSQFN